MIFSSVEQKAGLAPHGGAGQRTAAGFDWVFCLILVASAFLIFYQLGARPFWQDEAETACLAKNVIKYSVPKTFDGINLISQEEGREFSKDFLWSWSPWLQIYVSALGLKLGGMNTFAGRLPFALAGFVCIFLVYRMVRKNFNDIAWARLSAALLIFCVPFLLFARQGRYYTLGALLAVISLSHFVTDHKNQRSVVWSRMVTAVSLGLMFHANYLLFFSFAPALLASKFLISRKLPRIRDVLLPALTTGLIIVPGLIFYGIGKQGGMLDFTRVPVNLEQYMAGLLQFMIPLPIGIGLLVLWRKFLTLRGGPPSDPSERFALFLTLIILMSIFILALVPQCFHRYLVHLYPLAAIVLAWVILRIWSFNRICGVMLGFLLLFTNWLHVMPMERLGVVNRPWHNDTSMLTYSNFPLQLMLTEMFNGYSDVNQNLIDFFNENSDPDDTILITYGDLPLQFYTGRRVIGGLQGKVKLNGDLPDWVVKRAVSRTNRDDVLVDSDDVILNGLDLNKNYDKIVLHHADELFGNRPDPYYHSFIPLKEPYLPLTVYKLKAEKKGAVE